jgi:hypothetical protein
MKLYAVAIRTLPVLLAFTQAHAGGITGGGGGVTNPDPIQPQLIVSLVQNQTKPVLLSWLNSKEEKFQQLDPAEQATSPYRKLFAQSPNIFEVMETAGIDLELHQPCYDANREARDGSVHSRTPGYVCLSPFTMAPKLDESNYAPETMALVLHELTHKLGTTEAEATLIQKEALKVFRTIELEDFAEEIQRAASSVRSHENIFDLYIKTPGAFQVQTAATALERVGDLYRDLSFSKTSRYGSRMSMIRADGYAYLFTNAIRVLIASEFLSLQNPNTPDSIRKEIQRHLDSGFGSENEVPARVFMTKGLGSHGIKGKVYDQVLLQKITSEAEIPGQLVKFRDVLKETGNELNRLGAARFQTN